MSAIRRTLGKIAAAGLAVAIISALPPAIAASDEAPLAVDETPPASDETPLASDETPLAVDETPPATVELRVSDVTFEKLGRHGQFTYTREFIDHGGTGAKLRHGQVCFSGAGCISAPVEYLIEAGGVLLQEGQFLMPTAVAQTFDFTYIGEDGEGRYIGEDGEGRKITVKARILVVGDQLELQELE